jgi:hypothetical protein
MRFSDYLADAIMVATAAQFMKDWGTRHLERWMRWHLRPRPPAPLDSSARMTSGSDPLHSTLRVIHPWWSPP